MHLCLVIIFRNMSFVCFIVYMVLDSLLFISVAMKKPTTLPKVKLEYMVPLFELGLDVDSEKAKQLGKLIKNYYFGYTDLKPETILVYIMVIIGHLH